MSGQKQLNFEFLVHNLHKITRGVQVKHRGRNQTLKVGFRQTRGRA